MTEAVVYHGHGSALRIPGQGEDLVLRHGVPTNVPSEVAESLIDRDDCDLADAAPEAPVGPDVLGEREEEFEDDREDPAGVNADPPYGEE